MITLKKNNNNLFVIFQTFQNYCQDYAQAKVVELTFLYTMRFSGWNNS